MKRRFFHFASAAIVAAPSLMKLSTAALWTPEELVMPDQGPIAISVNGRDYVYNEDRQAWMPAPAGTPHWREFMPEDPPWPTRQMPPSREIDRRFARYVPDAEHGSDLERRVAAIREEDYRRLRMSS